MVPDLGAPILMLVTDRSAVKPVVHDTDVSCEQLLGLVEAWANAGVDIVHIRESTLPDRQLVALVRQARGRVLGDRGCIVVNDRPDIALAAGADGVHLKDDAIPVSRIRALGPPTWLVGRSIHDLAGAERAAREGGIDYLLVGAVHATPAKPGRAILGLDGLHRIARAVNLPVVAIGGLGFDEAQALADTGAAGMAGIRLFCDGTAASSEDRLARVRTARRVFSIV